jgi:hypothetical protein
MSDNQRLDDWKKMYEDNQYKNKGRREVSSTSNNVPNNSVVYQYHDHQIHTIHHIHSDRDSIKYVGFWRRLFAFIIDGILLSFVYLFTDSFGVHLAINILYYSILTSSPMMGTIGKAAIGAVVVDKKGQRISFIHALGRYICYFVSALVLGIGFIMVAFHGQKKGLHDLIGGTVVINKK